MNYPAIELLNYKDGKIWFFAILNFTVYHFD